MPHLLPEPSQTFICTASQLLMNGRRDRGLNKKKKKNDNTLIPPFTHYVLPQHLPLLLPPFIPRIPPPPPRRIDLFGLREDFQIPRRALQLHGDITEREILKIWEEGCLELTQRLSTALKALINVGLAQRLEFNVGVICSGGRAFCDSFHLHEALI